MRTRSINQAAAATPPPPTSAAESQYLSSRAPSLPRTQLPFESVASIQELEGNEVIQGQRQNLQFNPKSLFPDQRIDDPSEFQMIYENMIPDEYTEKQLNNLLTVAEISSKKQNMSIYEIIYLTDLKLRLIYIQNHRKEDFQPETMLRVSYIIALIKLVLGRKHNITGGKKLLSRNSLRAKKNKTNKKKKRKSVYKKKRSGKKI